MLFKRNLFVPDLNKDSNRVDYATEKGEEMKEKNFLDFIEKAIKNSRLRKQFVDELNRPGVKTEDLLKLFHNLGYGAVSRGDCKKILGFFKHPENLAKFLVVTPKY